MQYKGLVIIVISNYTIKKNFDIKQCQQN